MLTLLLAAQLVLADAPVLGPEPPPAPEAEATPEADRMVIREVVGTRPTDPTWQVFLHHRPLSATEFAHLVGDAPTLSAIERQGQRKRRQETGEVVGAIAASVVDRALTSSPSGDPGALSKSPNPMAPPTPDLDHVATYYVRVRAQELCDAYNLGEREQLPEP